MLKQALALLFAGTAIVVGHPNHVQPVKEEGKKPIPEFIGHNGLSYSVDFKWAKADRKLAPVRNGHALAEDEKGQIYFVTDHLDGAFIVFEKDGSYVRSFGKGLKGGHGIEFFKRNGEELLIHVDCGWHANPNGGKTVDGSGLITIMKKDGTVEFTLPNPRTIEKNPPKKKFKPCDVAVTPAGNFLVVDGYASDYIYEYSPKGAYIGRWGGRKKGKVDNLDNAHGISIDTSNPEQTLVWVSSRNQNQIKAFTLDGKYVETLDLPGAFAGQLFIRDGKMYTAVCWSKAKGGEGKRLSNSGFIIVIDAKTRKVISAPGGSEPIYKEGKLQPLYQEYPVFLHGHDLYVDKAGAIYVCEWASRNRYPIKLTPGA